MDTLGLCVKVNNHNVAITIGLRSQHAKKEEADPYNTSRLEL